MSCNERRHTSIIDPPLTHLTADQLHTLSQLRQQLVAVDQQHDGLTDSCLARFLQQHSYHLDLSKQALLNYLSWRSSNGIDTLLDSPPPKLDIIRAAAAYAYHGHDMLNQPIYYEKTGQIATDILADRELIPESDFLRSHVWGIEKLQQLCFERGLASGRRVEYFTSILDMAGLGFQHRNVIFLLKACLDLDNLYYPNLVGKVYILNLPWIAPTMYSFVNPFLSAHIKSKLHVVSGKPDTFLRSVIDPSQLLMEYGGSDTSDCLTVKDCSQYRQSGKQVADGFDRQFIKYDFEMNLTCYEKGATFNWFFEEESGYDIDFSVQIIESGQTKDSAPKRWAKPQSRCTTSKGSFQSSKACTLLFRWDNSFSWTTNKNIKYAVTAVQIDDVEGAKEATAELAAEQAMQTQ